MKNTQFGDAYLNYIMHFVYYIMYMHADCILWLKQACRPNIEN